MLTWHRALLALGWTLLTLLAASRNSLSDPQEILGRHYIRDGSRLCITDSNGEKWDIAPGVILVRFAPSVSAEEIAQFEHSNGVSPAARLTKNAAGYRQFTYATDRDPLVVLAGVVADPLVSDACLDAQIKFFGDPYFGNQWNLQLMRMEEAWAVTRGDPSITIAIIDNGTDYGHEDLSAATWLNPNDASGDFVDNDSDSVWYGSPMVDDFTGWDFWNNDNHPLPDGDAHGTNVAGIAMAVCDNNLGVAGASGSKGANGIKLMTLRVSSQAGSNVADAIEYAWRKGATVINMSFGIFNETAAAVPAQLDSAEAHGVIVVAAVGNFGEFPYPTSHVYFPASYPSVIAVGASDENNVRWPFSCMGPELDVLAPSGGVHPYGGRAEMWTTDNYQTSGSVNPESCGGCPSDNYRYYSNFGKTSGASPEVASIAALLKSFMPGLTPAQVRQRLTTSAIDLGDAGPDSLYGYGRVDAYRALTEWGTIMGNVTWRPEDTADSTRYISGDLTIAPGDTLTIMPGTIIKIANDDDLRSGSDTLRVEINVEGVLIVDGTIGNPVVFESWHPQGTDDWVGIYFDSTSSGGSLDRCRISRAEIAVDSYAPLELTNTTIDSCSYAGVVSRKGGALIHGCQLSLPGDIGIRVDEDEVTVRSTTVDGALMHGISAYAGSSLAIRGSILTNSDTGLYVEGTASADVDSSSFFYQNDTGVHFYDAGTASTIRSCGITWNSSGGVLCDASSSPRIVSNIFAHNGGAIYCSNSSSPTIESNQIQSAGNAITVTSSSSPDVGHKPKTGSQSSGDNSIAHAVKYISNSTGASISAQNNCWNVNGTPPCSPAASKFVGTVDYTEPKCCSFPVFSHGEGEPDFGEGFIFQLPGDASPERKKPSVTGLFGILPNPFNPQTTIRYSLASQTRVEIAIYDVAGRLVQVLANETQVVGQHSLVWKGTDRRGSPVASGIYFVRMIAAGEVFTRKMVLLK